MIFVHVSITSNHFNKCKKKKAVSIQNNAGRDFCITKRISYPYSVTVCSFIIWHKPDIPERIHIETLIDLEEFILHREIIYQPTETILVHVIGLI